MQLNLSRVLLFINHFNKIMSNLMSPKTQTPYSSGIYNRLGSEQKDSYSFWSLFPGVPHLIAKKQILKGWVLVLGAAFALFSLFSLFIPQLSEGVFGLLTLLGNKNSAEIAELFRFTLWFKLVYGFLLCFLLSYLIAENKKDIQKNFRNLEADRKPAVFAASMSSSYLFSICSFFALLIYGFAHFVPIQREQSIQLEMLSPFVDNPPQKQPPKKAPKEAKHSAIQNAVNSGRHDKKLPLSPGNQQPKPQTGRTTPSKPNKSVLQKFFQPKAAPSPSEPASPSPPQPKAVPHPSPPQPKSSSSSSNSSKPLLPSFKPLKGDDRAILSSNEPDNIPAPIKPIGGGGSSGGSSSGNPSSGGGGGASRGPVLPSRSGGFSQGSGLGNAGPNNNPNGPVTVAARKDVDYGAFMQDLQRRIQSAWKPASADKADQVQLSFSLRKDGSLVPGSVSTVKTSNPEAEAAARQAVIAASPGFRPLPEGSADQVRIDFTFTRTGTRFMGLKKY